MNTRLKTVCLRGMKNSEKRCQPAVPAPVIDYFFWKKSFLAVSGSEVHHLTVHMTTAKIFKNPRLKIFRNSLPLSESTETREKKFQLYVQFVEYV